jgi:hypothetical protein
MFSKSWAVLHAFGSRTSQTLQKASSYVTEPQTPAPVSLTGPGIPKFVPQYKKEVFPTNLKSTCAMGYGHHTPGPISSLRAVSIDDVSIENLQLGISDTNTPDTELSSCLVKLPVDSSSLAVLSWRWDGDHKGRGSKNILAAIIYAKQVGIRYLFIDVVSIDQNLQGDALIKQVMFFSTLYRTIPVLAAYTEEGSYFWHTAHRPWILTEMLLIRTSPFEVTFIDYSIDGLYSQQSNKTIYSIFRGLAGPGRALLDCLLSLLYRQCDMAALSDLKFLMPSYAKVLAIAYEKMSRNDYVLTAIALLQLYVQPHTFTASLRRRGSFPLSYDQYEVRPERKDSLSQAERTQYVNEVRSFFVLSLRGRKVIHVRVTTHQWNNTDDKEIAIRCHTGADLAILDALDISAEETAEYLAQEDTRKRNWKQENKVDRLTTPSWRQLTLLPKPVDTTLLSGY